MNFKNSLISLLLLAFSAQASSELLDKTVVIVNDEVITQNEWNQEYLDIKDNFKQRGKQLPDTPAIRQQVLDKLVLTAVLLQEARDKRITVSEQQIQAAIKQVAASNRMSLDQFRRALTSRGKNYTAFYQKVRDELTIQQLQKREVNRLAKVSDQEIEVALAQKGWDDNKEYHTAHILLPIPDAATPQQVKEQLNKINDLLEQLKQGADFNQLAQQHSSGRQALEGGDLGWRKQHELPSLFVEPVSQLQNGDFSDPIRSPSGFHILRLIATRSANQVIVSQTRARHILIAPDALQTEEDVIDKLVSIRDRIIQGDDFATLARANSVDHVSASQGGDLGWLSKGETVAAFEEVMNTMQGDDISQPFKSQFGWHILQVTGHKTIDDTQAAQRSKIKQQLLTRKKQEVLELWHKRLHDQAYIKIL